MTYGILFVLTFAVLTVLSSQSTGSEESWVEVSSPVSFEKGKLEKGAKECREIVHWGY